jgi:single-stranded-DNA-specific exonuclease
VLRRLGARVVPFVPHRVRDGYDLGPAGIRRAAEADARLILTADCGVVAHDAVEAATQAGIDVIVTDHHVPGATLPPARAVVDPKRADCSYPNPSLSGTGVAYKVALALARARGLPDQEVHYSLDLVALATVADVMPLRGENRIMTRFGLRVLQETRAPGLRALVAAAGLDGRTLTAGHLSHGLAPRLNAVGRLEDAGTGLRLLLAEEADAAGLARELETANTHRRAVDAEILEQAIQRLDGRYDAARDRAIVLDGDGWHPGVIGIVASRLVERYHRPTVLIARTDGDGFARGSARSIPGFDLLEAVRACGGHLERFGGTRPPRGSTSARRHRALSRRVRGPRPHATPGRARPRAAHRPAAPPGGRDPGAGPLPRLRRPLRGGQPYARLRDPPRHGGQRGGGRAGGPPPETDAQR